VTRKISNRDFARDFPDIRRQNHFISKTKEIAHDLRHDRSARDRSVIKNGKITPLPD
jgi:hypothetical protein